jgi:hypothetical protein
MESMVDLAPPPSPDPMTTALLVWTAMFPAEIGYFPDE